MARRQKKRQAENERVISSNNFSNAAFKLLKLTRKWVERGTPNVRHHEALPEAEFAMLRGKPRVACKQYAIAVVLAARQGFVQDAALANEQYCIFLLRDVGDEEEATYRPKEAVKL